MFPSHLLQTFLSGIYILSSTLILGGCFAANNPNALASIPQSSPTPSVSTLKTEFPRYKHIFLIIEENKSYEQIMGNPNALHINELAKTYGEATTFYGVVHPSEANYIAMLGGSTFGIHDDDAFYCKPGLQDPFCHGTQAPDYPNHTIASRSLMDQLTEKGLTWKGYFEDIPSPGSKVVIAPDVTRAYYAVKHNGFMNFKTVQDDRHLDQKIVPLTQLTLDLKNGEAPNYSHIVFNQCHEMHGLLECLDLQKLIHDADTLVGQTVNQIMSSKLWTEPENSAIIITWDEDNNPAKKTGMQGCCGFDPASAANFGGGHIPTIVITNHGPRGVKDPTPYNLYSLLRTTEDAFGIEEYLNEANNTAAGVRSMNPLFVK